uniref:Uncharacterized protein n=1 Tax=Arundo donax TaxID=35708 RepID=A0A0A9G451_ARUDO
MHDLSIYQHPLWWSFCLRVLEKSQC